MTTLSINNDTRPDSPHRTILDRIPSGRDNAVSMRYLASILGRDERQIRHMIENARIDGNIIAGTGAGIFIPETEAELREYVNRTYSHITTSVKTLNPAIKLTGRSIVLLTEGDDNV